MIDPAEFVTNSRLSLMKAGLEVWADWMSNMYEKPILEHLQTFEQERFQIASSMVDAKLGKIGQRLRLLDASVDRTDLDGFFYHWTYLQLLLSFWQRYDDLNPSLQLNLLYQSGLNFTKKNLATAPRLEGRFTVLYQEFEKVEKLRQREVWFLDKDGGRFHLLRDFAFGNQPFEQTFITGRDYGGQLIPLPFDGSVRCWKENLALMAVSSEALDWSKYVCDLHSLNEKMHDVLLLNPFLEALPVVLSLQTVYADGEWYMLDHQRQRLSKLVGSDFVMQSIFAACYYQPTVVVGLWSRMGFQPWATVQDGQYQPVLL
ncbi:hypothetical protein [Membranihabitans marinus]|uniref:hypothetical protein n=1 Tax=Membranihabitans marinus TaxID=1227546 RepID=UPI001F326462|nr:hypothetical protein [Membranihabitans marinus]